MQFRSNRCVAIHVPDLAAAERFYSDVMRFTLKSKTTESLEYATGELMLYVNRDARALGPIPSFDVPDAVAAKKLLEASGCMIIDDREGSFYFRDPFGVVYDVVEE